MQILIIGAGAAGCFAAIELKRRLPKAGVTVVEAQRRPLAKVAITGGGRCNLTNSFATVKSLEQVYPRGARLMKRLFREFDHLDTLAWFEKEGVRLVTQEDECVFPAAQDARVVIHCLLDLMEQYGVRLLTNYRVTRIIPRENGYTILPKGATTGALPTFEADSVIVATGGSPRVSGMAFLDGLDLSIVPPVPSLFGLSLPDHPLCQLTGTVVENVNLALAGTKIRTSGPLLITHRGISGPAVLKLSSHAARLLAEADYQAEVVVNWAGEEKVAEIAARLLGYVKDYPARQLSSVRPHFLHTRHWLYLLETADLTPTRTWGEIGRKQLNRLAAVLTGQSLRIVGRDPFKEEFVTCGGVALTNLNFQTLECKTRPGLYFVGEATDVDAVTGGFNLQAAWTMGYIAARAIAERYS